MKDEMQEERGNRFVIGDEDLEQELQSSIKNYDICHKKKKN
jgi:hypothetical protein